MSRENDADPNPYPEAEELAAQISRRHRTGTIWRSTFMLATILAIVVLVVLLINIINQSFGLTAVQSEIPENVVVQQYFTERVLAASATSGGEDDQALADGIGSAPNGTGFLGYAFYINNTDKLRALTVAGVAPAAETASNGEYPLTRPLYIYTSMDKLEEKPELAAFVRFYLSQAAELVDSVGYFPVDGQTASETEAGLTEVLGVTELGQVDPAALSGEIMAIGSSTVFPVTSLAASSFEEAGFGGQINVESVGTSGGFRSFCIEGQEGIDLINASRPVNPVEFDACRQIGRELVEIRIGTDALAVVVNKSNDFVDDISLDELQLLFTDAEQWSDVNSAWPAEPVSHYVPGADSGTMDFFIDAAFQVELADLSKEALVSILQANVNTNVGRRLERDQRFFENRLVFEAPDLWEEVCSSDEPPAGCIGPARSQRDVYLLVQERVVVPTVLEAWFLLDSLMNRPEIALEAGRLYPNAQLEFRSWLTSGFIGSPQSAEPELAGVRTAVLGTLWVIFITMLFAFPIGIGAAIYLEEYADHDKWYNRIIQTNINNLAGVPSIIYGMLGLAVFVRAMEPITSGAVFGVLEAGATANGRTVLSAGLTLALLILPIIIISAQESIKAVPSSLRQASYGLGATRWQTIWSHVLPTALPGILTGAIIAMSRAIGETAPLVVVGASTFITTDPTGPFSKFTVLPIQIFQWTTRPQSVFRNIAAAAIIVLLILLLLLNATAVYIRNRSGKELG